MPTTFYSVLEARGGTPSYARYNTKESSSIGTFGCVTCVGVYFKVNHEQCFIAHINAASSTTFDNNIVTDPVGKDLTTEVLRRLSDHARANEWDPSEEEFGEGLTIVCPWHGCDPEEGYDYQRVGWYVVKAIRHFFKHLAEDVERPKKEDPVPLPLELKIWRRGRAAFLNGVAMKTEIDTTSNGFVVDTKSGNVEKLPLPTRPGHICALDCAPYVPWPLRNMSKTDWYFHVEGDSPEQFPYNILNLAFNLELFRTPYYQGFPEEDFWFLPNAKFNT